MIEPSGRSGDTRIDRIFLAALTFRMLVAGTLAIGSAMPRVDARSVALKAQMSPPRVVQQQRVVLTSQRSAAAIDISHLQNTAPTLHVHINDLRRRPCGARRPSLCCGSRPLSRTCHPCGKRLRQGISAVLQVRPRIGA